MNDEQPTPSAQPQPRVPLPPWHTLPLDRAFGDVVATLDGDIADLFSETRVRAWRANGHDGRVRYTFALHAISDRARFIALYVRPLADGSRCRFECEWLGTPRHHREYALLMTVLLPPILGELPSPVIMTLPPQIPRRPGPDQVIEAFYRKHAQNKKITLKQVCEELGADYGYIRKRKVAYDMRKKSKRSR